MKERLISLSSSSSSGDENSLQQLTINEHYAKAFQYRKEREELAKLKEKYGSDADTDGLSSDESDSESGESEDEDGEELTPALDAAILRTLARIKARDPNIYDAARNVFDEEHSKSTTLPAPAHAKKARADKPLTLQEQRLAAALDVTTPRSRSSSPAGPSLPPTHAAEQAALRVETIAAFHSSATAAVGSAGSGDGSGDAEQEEEGGLFTLREKTKDEVEREETEYRAYLEREVGPLEKILDLGEEGKVEDGIGRLREDDVPIHPGETDTGKKKRKKKGKKGAEKRKETDQEFLVNYILNRGWIDRSARRIPTYKEITTGPSSVRDPDPTTTPAGADVDADANAGDLLVEDDEFDEVAEHFESSYNFRFEEPDAPHIPSFPRAVETVRRQTDHADRRRAARERRRERKEAEKAQRREEVKRLKGLKSREVEAKLERIGKEGGWARSQALDALDLDGDWDAETHDRQMAAVLAETDGVAAGGDDEKPTWDDDIDVGDLVPPSGDEAPHASAAKERKKAKKKEKKKRMKDDDAGGVDVDEMDADAPEDGGSKWDEVEWDGTEEMRKRVLDQYMDDLYELEFNDMVCLPLPYCCLRPCSCARSPYTQVAGMPTRFRYTPVANTSFALTPAEILLADDKDLNEYVGLRKLAPYRNRHDTWDAKRAERLREFKKKVSARVGGGVGGIIGAELVVDGDGERRAKKRKGKKERMREKAARAPDGAEMSAEVEDEAADSPQPSIERAKRPRDDEGGYGDVVATRETEPVKKKRRRQKKSGMTFEEAAE
ncbi:KRI1-like family-domain-containing protein [Lactifluus subvellereus]|nr:KRI1-like family-domain-containing protein [Lactifluus subvellereus]